jgi:hypothetical protein
MKNKITTNLRSPDPTPDEALRSFKESLIANIDATVQSLGAGMGDLIKFGDEDQFEVENIEDVVTHVGFNDLLTIVVVTFYEGIYTQNALDRLCADDLVAITNVLDNMDTAKVEIVKLDSIEGEEEEF